MYQRIIGFASCFNCKDTYTYQSGGSGSTKHLLRRICSKKLSLDINQEGPIDKFVKLKTSSSSKLTAQERANVRNELTKWICASIRPCNIVADPGLKSTLKIVVDICELFNAFKFE